jgi:hypothetical protein
MLLAVWTLQATSITLGATTVTASTLPAANKHKVCDMDEIDRYLLDQPLLQPLDPLHISAMRQFTRLVCFQPEEGLFHAGEPAGEFYLRINRPRRSPSRLADVRLGRVRRIAGAAD